MTRGKKATTTRTQSGSMSQKKRDTLDSKQYAFPAERKEPINDAKHVRNAIARFDQVEDVSDKERDKAWTRIKKAAKKHGVDVEVKSWHELGSNGGKKSAGKKAAKKATAKKK
jgi:hypothetical protein